MKKYDVAIIGAGTSGLSARREVVKKTDNYIVIDDGILGTTCARVGCMPSKVMIQTANDFHRKGVFEEIGISGAENLSIDTAKAMKHVRKLRDRFVKATLGSYEDWQDSKLIRKTASFVDQNTLDLDGETIWAKKIIIATGSSPVLPEPWAEYKDYLLDTDSVFEMTDVPPKMAVIGLGVIGIELGQALHRLGVDLVAIGRSQSIGGLKDPELMEYSAKKFSEELNTDLGGVQSMSEKNGKLVIQTKEKTYEVDKALIAVGRKPNIARLKLENLGVSLSDKGMPDFDSQNMQIKGTSVFIAGDTNGQKPLLHESADEGAIAGYNSVASDVLSFKRRAPLSVTFSDPNIAVVGMGYTELSKKKIDFVSGKLSYEGQGRAIVKLKEKGLLKVYGDPKTGLLLGAEMFGPSMEHIAHLLAWAIQNKMTAHQSLSMPFYHPVIEEGLRTALRDLAKKTNQSNSPLELEISEV